MGAVLTEVVVDAGNPERLAAFWAEVLGWERTEAYDGVVEIAGADGGRPKLIFVPVEEVKAGKNRLHLDVNPTGCDQDEELARLLSLGAVEVDVGQGQQTWFVLADPEGNEFCLLRMRVD
ncbi:MAG TPA: VOC family protein [Acidimicrobiales bacterium]|nr:VOC family protein [Acidimicrobiales bacterium]